MASAVMAGNADRMAPRILPKVFADIPSQRELEKAHKARKVMGIWVVVLLVMLLASVGLAAWEAW